MQSPAAGGGFDIVGQVLNSGLDTRGVLAVCAVFSLFSWYIIGAKWWEFRGIAAARQAFFQAVDRVRTFDEREKAMASLGPSPYARLVRTTADFIGDLHAAMQRDGVTRSGLSLTQLEALTLTLNAAVREESHQASRQLSWLATIAATAPLVGLFGTVLGIVHAFVGVAEGSSGNIAAVAPGIAMALVATAAGLFAAIPAVMAYNLFTTRLERFEGELERIAEETIGALGREGRL